MKEIKLNISGSVRAEHLKDVSCYNENYYKIQSRGDSCGIHYPYNIIREICHEEDDYFEYSLGSFFEGEEYAGNFVEAFSWTSEYGAESLFEGV